MRIAFAAKSSFLAPILAALDAAEGIPLDGTLRVMLSQQGYDGQVVISIDPADEVEFWTDWDGTDVTRFPARVKAAATALRDRRCFGLFMVAHDAGMLQIARIPPAA